MWSMGKCWIEMRTMFNLFKLHICLQCLVLPSIFYPNYAVTFHYFQKYNHVILVFNWVIWMEWLHWKCTYIIEMWFLGNVNININIPMYHKKKKKNINIPRDKWVDGRAPFVLDHVKIWVAYTTKKNFECYILLSRYPTNIPYNVIFSKNQQFSTKIKINK